MSTQLHLDLAANLVWAIQTRTTTQKDEGKLKAVHSKLRISYMKNKMQISFETIFVHVKDISSKNIIHLQYNIYMYKFISDNEME